MSEKLLDRRSSEGLTIPERRVVIKDPSELPTSYSQTPGGTIFSTTPGGKGGQVCCLYLIIKLGQPTNNTRPSNPTFDLRNVDINLHIIIMYL